MNGMSFGKACNVVSRNAAGSWFYPLLKYTSPWSNCRAATNNGVLYEHGAKCPANFLRISSNKPPVTISSSSGPKRAMASGAIEGRFGADEEMAGADKNLAAADKELAAVVATARSLIQNSYFTGLLAAISSCSETPKSFVVVDSPSGSGKSCAGIALRELDHTRNDNLANVAGSNLKMRVAHIVWPTSVDSQLLYVALHKQQKKEGVLVKQFYTSATELFANQSSIPDRMKYPDLFEAYVWKHLLQPLFNADDDRDEFLWVLYLDEIPVAHEDVVLISFVRDLVRFVPNVIPILAGTSSKAGNMIGLSLGDASANTWNFAKNRWAVLCTRLPQYFPSSSPHAKKWELLQKSEDAGVRAVVKVIRKSITNGGNPRAINYAIATLSALEARLPLKADPPSQSSGEDVCVVDDGNRFFFDWQQWFSDKMMKDKFSIKRVSQFPDILTGQTNLLLNASSNHKLADAVVQRHFAYRSVPDYGATCSSKQSARFEECCGWLHIGSNRARGLGYKLYYLAHKDIFMKKTPVIYDWQTAVFNTFAKDPLIYLGCCWDGGFFCNSRGEQYTASEVLEALWSGNVFGSVNFQNPNAEVNTGSYMEVLIVLSIINAAAVSKFAKVPLAQFLRQFTYQLKIPSIPDFLQRDPAVANLSMTRYLVPVKGTDEGQELDYIGMVRRDKNLEQSDTTVHFNMGRSELDVQVRSITFEGKFAKDAAPVETVAGYFKKLIREDGAIGVLVVRTSAQFWEDRIGMKKTKESNLANMTASLKGSNVGIAYFIREDGVMETLDINRFCGGRAILIRIPMVRDLSTPNWDPLL